MPLVSYNTFRGYDPGADTDTIRIVGYSGHGSYWVTRPATGPGQSRRDQLNDALDLIDEAIDRGDEPGEVAWRDIDPLVLRQREIQRRTEREPLQPE